MCIFCFVCCCFTSYQHLGSYQDGYRLVSVHIPGDLIVLHHWVTRPAAPWPDSQLSHIFLTQSPFLIMPSAWIESDKHSFLSHWFYSTRVQTGEFQIPWSPKRSIHSAIPSGWVCMCVSGWMCRCECMCVNGCGMWVGVTEVPCALGLLGGVSWEKWFVNCSNLDRDCVSVTESSGRNPGSIPIYCTGSSSHLLRFEKGGCHVPLVCKEG